MVFRLPAVAVLSFPLPPSNLPPGNVGLRFRRRPKLGDVPRLTAPVLSKSPSTTHLAKSLEIRGTEFFVKERERSVTAETREARHAREPIEHNKGAST